jgi:hypothetical protein
LPPLLRHELARAAAGSKLAKKEAAAPQLTGRTPKAAQPGRRAADNFNAFDETQGTDEKGIGARKWPCDMKVKADRLDVARASRLLLPGKTFSPCDDCKSDRTIATPRTTLRTIEVRSSLHHATILPPSASIHFQPAQPYQQV